MNHNLKLTQTTPRPSKNSVTPPKQIQSCLHKQPASTNIKLILTLLIACSTVFFALFAPSACKAALLHGYEICTTQLLFALFPFLIAANLLVLCNVAPLLGRPLRPLFRSFGFCEECTAGLFCIALLGGFAPAVSALAQCVRTNTLSKQQASKLLPALCFLGPSYIIVAIGEGMLGNLIVGIYLFTSQVCSSLFVLLLLHISTLRKKKTRPHSGLTQKNRSVTPLHISNVSQAVIISKCNEATVPTPKDCTSNPLGTGDITHFTLSTVIADSFFAFLRLCGVILYFQFLAAGFCTLLPTQYHWLCEMMLEVTAACGQITAQGHDAAFRCCAALSLLSGSILLQIAALCPTGVSCVPLLYTRLLHLPISLFIFRLLLQIPQPQTVYCSLSSRVIAMQRLPCDQAILLFIAILFLFERLRKPLQSR